MSSDNQDDKMTEQEGAIRGAVEAEKALRAAVKATEANVETYGDRVHARVVFEGFETLGDAVAKAESWAGWFNRQDWVDGVQLSVDTDGEYDPETDERSTRPTATLNVRTDIEA